MGVAVLHDGPQVDCCAHGAPSATDATTPAQGGPSDLPPAQRSDQIARAASVAHHGAPPAVALADRLEIVSAKLQGYIDEQTNVVEPKRSPLKLGVEKAVSTLREGLEQMDGRLRNHFSPAFIDSLYPELTRRGAMVADEDDEDDDDSGPPDGSGSSA